MSLRRSLVAPYCPEFTGSGPSRFGVAPISAPTPGGRFAHAVFSASRLRGAFICVRWRRRPRGSFTVDFFRLAYRARTQAVIATWPEPSKSRRRPWDSSVPSQCCFRPQVMASFNASHPHAVSPRAAASFIVAGSTAVTVNQGLWPRLLGFGPADEPCRVICRPRYSFYAQGRSNPPADTAMGFSPLSGFRRAGLRRAYRWHALTPVSFANRFYDEPAVRVAKSLVPFGVVRNSGD